MWLTFHRISRALFEINRRKTSHRPRFSTHLLRLEVLEDRAMLSTYVVTTTADSGAGSLRDAILQVNADTNHALYPSPNDPSVDEIDFNITAASDAAGGGTGYNTTTGVATIAPLSALPAITNSVFINGYSQPGSSWNTLANDDNAVLRIQLNGRNLPIPNGFGPFGLIIDAGNSTVRGLVINGFLNGGGIGLQGAGDRVQGNFIGTDVSGTSAPYGLPDFTTSGPSTSDLYNGVGVTESTGFQQDYVGMDSQPDLIDPTGWTHFAERNIISACGEGVKLIGPAVSGPSAYGPAQINNVVAGNFIGTDIHGTTALGNWVGIIMQSGTHDDLIGTDGGGANVGNVISGNFTGLVLNSPQGGIGEFRSAIAGNWIGTDPNGGPMGNLAGGVILLQSALDVRIGGPSAALGNTIAYNGTAASSLQNEVPSRGKLYANAAGVWIFTAGTSPQGITVQGNPIYGNAGLGIDLGGSYPPLAADGVTLNDSAGHVGPNNFQNFPVLNSASSSSTSTLVAGTFSEAAEPNTMITLDFYANPTEDPSGYGQGQTYLGSRTVYTDGSGNASFTADLAVGNLASQWITATATVTDSNSSYNGNTSEFSLDIQASSAPSQTFAQSLAGSLPQSTVSPNTMTIQADPTTINDVVSGLSTTNLGSSVVPVSVYLNLAPGTYQSQTIQVPQGMTLYINGQQGTTIDPASPALTVVSGSVIVSHVTLVSTGDAPTILVTGGNVTLLNDDIIQSSTSFTDPAIAVTGGTLNLGTATTPGNNTLSVSNSGYLVSNTSGNAISAVGDTFVVGGTVQTAPNLSFTTLTSSAATAILNQPVILTATVQVNGSSGTPTGSVDFFDETTNTYLGSAPLSGGVATRTTSTLNLGNHVIVAKYSGDANFLPSAGSFTQSIHYNFSGFLPPLGNGLSFAVNRTIPIKFTLTDYNGTAITSLSAVTSLQIQALDANGNPVGAPFTPVSTDKQGLQYTGGQYQFNWKTKGLVAGSYEIELTLADGTMQTKTIQLTSNGNGSNAQATDGSDVNGSTVGQLLGGNVALYVDNSNGDLTPDELARIQDAVNSVDATIAPYGVAINEVTDPTQADVTLNMGTNSAVGGYAQGILGCYTTTGTITLIQGWNWYDGADPTQIGGNQYDFQTTVTHELGHALGLGESAVTTSAMSGTLSPATTIRTLTTADLNIPYDDGSSDAQRAAVPPFGTVAGAVPGNLAVSAQGENVPSSSNPPSAADPLLANLALLLGNVRNAYQSELSSVTALWQNFDALALQRLDALLSLEAGAMGMSKNTLMRDLLFANLYSPNEA